MPVSPEKGRKPFDSDQLLELAQRLMAGVGKVALVVMLCSLVYILWGVLGGYLTVQTTPLLERNLSWAAGIFSASAVALTAAVFVRFFADTAFIYVMALLGAICFFGMPMIINARAANDSQVAQAMVSMMLVGGELIFFMVAARAVYELYQRAKRGEVDPAEREQTVIAPAKKAKPRSFSLIQPCWELPYCHEHIRVACPQWLKRRTCWRDKHGCNCDPTMIEAMLRSGAATRGVGTHQQRTAASYLRADMEDKAEPRPAGPQPFQQTIPCSKCPIYNEHQRQKFRVLNPLTAVGCALALYVAYLEGYFDVVFQWLITSASHVIAQLSFEGGRAASQPAWLTELNTPGVKWLFIILVSITIFTYAVKVLEWAIFVKKI